MDYAKEFNLSIPTRINEKDKILIIDSQQDMRMIVAHQLQKLRIGHVFQARDGMEALEKLHTDQYAAIICDMDLPQMDALMLLQEIREDHAINRPPFCVMLGNANKEKIMLAIEGGVDEILVKPFTLDDIIPKLRKAFAGFHNPKNPEKVYELAKEKLRTKNYADATRIYQMLSQSSADSARPHVGLARVALAQKDFAKALAELAQAETKNPNYVHLYSTRGEVFLTESKLSEAVDCYKKAITLSPLNPNRYKVAGEVLFRLEKYTEATHILQAAIDKEISFSALYHLLSQSYYLLKDYVNSAKYVRKAILREPENTVYLNQLALSLKESGEYEEAKKAFNQVLKLDPENLQALYNKALVLEITKKPDEAVKILERLVKKYPHFDKGHAKLKELHEMARSA